ncbi:hypothetical protein D3C85_1182700 [compost metagenome]
MHRFTAARCERTADRRFDQIRGSTDDRDQRLALLLVQTRHRPQQSFGIRMLRILKDFPSGTRFHHFTSIHDDDPVTHAGNHAEIMCNQNDGGPQFLLHILHNFHDLRLNRYIKRCCRLICNQQGRAAGQGNGDHYTLAHPAGEFVGILVKASLRIFDAN